MRKAILFLALLLFGSPVKAQTPHPWEIGLGAGLGAYDGDLHKTKAGFGFVASKPSVSVQFRHNLSNHFAARLGFLYTGIVGDDHESHAPAWRQTRGFSFTSPLLEWSIQGEIYPFGLFKPSKRDGGTLDKNRRRIAPFLSLGIGGAYFKPKIDWNTANNNGGVSADRIQTDLTEAQKFAIAIPMGAGIRFKVSKQFTLGLEVALRSAQSDYLDGISVAGNPEKNDWYHTAQVVGTYAFGTPQKANTRKQKPEEQMPLPDADEDGVADEIDECPELPGIRSLQGCPDTDRDGIADKNDLCPETSGLPTLNGCPDMDEDGIADKDDSCPELKGVPAYRGCPAVDRDKDGVADAEDLCPDMSGQLHWKGCPDSDSDGIPDNKDGCPGIAGSPKLRGCPDTDGDGISDKEDECPTIAGSIETDGCPEALPAAPGVPYKAIYFNSTLDNWQVTSLITIDEIVAILNADPEMFASIEGHTDNTGKEPANDLLSEKRAQRCLENLVSKGIASERLNYIGFGSKKPVVPNDSRENRQLNRRVEIHFYRK